jgi:hypothetical protein
MTQSCVEQQDFRIDVMKPRSLFVKGLGDILGVIPRFATSQKRRESKPSHNNTKNSAKEA